MPATVLVDPATFTSAISMGALPREVFGQQGVQERTKDGLPRWTVGVAVSYAPDAYGITAPSEVLNIGVVSAEDPGLTVPPGTAVTFDGLRVGASAPEQRERKDGSGMRVVGGRMFWSAASIRPAQSWSRGKSDAA
jgi:hypothetical protein